MKEITQKVRVSLPQNNKKLSDAHPDFLGKLQLENASWTTAVWLSTTKRNDPYLSLQLTGEGSAQTEKIKLAIWKNHERQREKTEDPHFESTQEMFGCDFQLRAWVMPVGDDFRLELIIEPLNGERGEISEALGTTKRRLADLLAETGAAKLPPNSTRTSAAADKTATPTTKPVQDDDNEPDDIPFVTWIYRDVRQSRLNRRVF
jgi:hypothetical protein